MATQTMPTCSSPALQSASHLAQLWPCTGGLTSPWWQSCHRHPARGAHTQVRNHRIMESFPLVQALVKNQSPKTFLFITDSTLRPIPNPFIYQLPTRTLFDSTACCQTLVDQWKKLPLLVSCPAWRATCVQV